MKKLLLACITIAMIACGGKKGGGDVDGGGGDDGGGSGDGGPLIDAMLPVGCTGPIPGTSQCSNCIDDDNDGFTDANDIECTTPGDNDEGSFKTGLPGDNVDPKNQDCFFDGNSGAGNDGCNIHTCCLLGAKTAGECPFSGNYDPAKCPPPIGSGVLDPMCIDVCGKATPPGCDCFGCCTLCEQSALIATGTCYDININPAISPNCTAETLADENLCKRCTKTTVCGGDPCGGQTCILCPGQDPSDLPAECQGMTNCPEGTAECSAEVACAEGSYCDNGCCLGIIL